MPRSSNTNNSVNVDSNSEDNNTSSSSSSFMEPNIFEIYKNYHENYSKKYGQNCVILMQVGMFHEFYGVDNDQEKIGQVKEISELLNIAMTRRNKKILENNRKNFLMAGFPTASLERYINVLLDYSYTVVIVDQVTKPPNVVERAVTRICSPGTVIDSTQIYNDNNYLMSIYFETENMTERKSELITVGLSAIDLSTGHSTIYEAYSTIDDINLAIDECYRFIQSHNPREIIIYNSKNKGNSTSNHGTENSGSGNNNNNIRIDEDWLKENLDLHDYVCHYRLGMVPKDYYKISYQNEFLGKVFINRGVLTPIEYLDLEKNQLSVISYLLLLQFAYEHNEKIIENLDKPVIWESTKHLTLTNNAIQQLNLVQVGSVRSVRQVSKSTTNKYHSVFDVICHTSTAMGKRLLKDRLLNPILHEKILEQRYNYIDNLLQQTTPTTNDEPSYILYEVIENKLKNIIDLERLRRKISLRVLQPMDFNTFDASIRETSKLTDLLTKKKEDYTAINQMMDAVAPNMITGLTELIKYYTDILNLDDTAKYTLNDVTDSFFKVGYNKEIDEISYKIRHYTRYFDLLTKQISGLIVKASDCVILKHNETSGYYLNLTQKRYEILQKSWTKPLVITVDDTEYTVNLSDFTCEKVSSKSNNYNLYSEQNNKLSNTLIQLQKEIKEKTVTAYIEFLNQFDKKYGSTVDSIIRFIAELDVAKSGAKSAIKYGYTKPKILKDQSPTENSSVNIKQLRHPIIERINTQIKYVPHDVELNGTGMLVYGVNSCGKSSLMKAIGISMVMAQAGMYVPAQNFEYKPYKFILTRILGNDNLFKGLSSFAVEMAELRGILKRANKHSLVLGDEICHGTETVSAVSIVASAILHLSECSSSFIFATHLHQLNDIEEIQDLNNVESYHLKVHYDLDSGELVYDRNLLPGSGDPIYGLEVAKAMQLDSRFIERANSIRKNIMSVNPELLTTKKSRYNANIYMDKCLICEEKAEHTHHIDFQCTANQHNFINHYHKNIDANLVPLCQPCHIKVHNPVEGKQFFINGYIETSNGRKLDFYEKTILESPRTETSTSTSISTETGTETGTETETSTGIETTLATTTPKKEIKIVPKIIPKKK